MHCKRGPVLRHSNWKRRNEEKQKNIYIYKATSTIFISSMCVCVSFCARARLGWRHLYVVFPSSLVLLWNIVASHYSARGWPIPVALSLSLLAITSRLSTSIPLSHTIRPNVVRQRKRETIKKILRCGGFRGNSLTNLNILSMFAQRPRNDMHCSEEILIAIEFALLVVVAAILLCAECFAFFFLLNG